MNNLISFLLTIHFSFLQPSAYKIGDKIENFELKNVDGKMYSLNNRKDVKGYIIVFTCNHCPFSVAYEDRILALDKKYSKLGYPVLAINPNDEVKVPEDSFDQMKKRAKSKKFTFPYLHDNTQEIAKKFGAARTPHVFIVKKENEDFILKYIGAIDNNSESAEKANVKYAKNALDALLNGKEPEPAETKAVGCTIKWK
jgi:peroxiredoxin